MKFREQKYEFIGQDLLKFIYSEREILFLRELWYNYNIFADQCGGLPDGVEERTISGASARKLRELLLKYKAIREIKNAGMITN